MQVIHKTGLGLLVAFAGLLGMLSQPVQAGSRAVSAEEIAAAPSCGRFPADRDEYLCNCPSGFAKTGLWGDGPYTGDSNICAAAMQTGTITQKGGPVLAVAAPGQSAYSGATKNGVTSSSWHSYDRSFAILPLNAMEKQARDLCGRLPSGVDSYQCSCPKGAGKTGMVWGSSPYTGDSDICAAAVHSGIIDETGGDVSVLRVQGLAGYHGTESFGVKTADWGKYDYSFVFDWNR